MSLMSVMGEKPLGNFHGKDDSKDYRYRHLDGHEAAPHRQEKFSGSEIIGEPEDTGSGNQREDSADDEDLRRASGRDSAET